MLASAGYDNKIRLWNSNGELLKTLEGHEKFVTGVSFSPDGKTLASSSEDGKIRLWSIDGATSSDQKIIGKIIDSHNDIVYGIAFSPDGETIASANFDKTVKLWNRKGDLLKTLEGHQSEVASVNFSPDGTIASASWDRTVKLWNLEGQLLKTLTGHNEKVWDVSFSPDGQIIASASGGDNTIRLWKAETLDFNSLKQRGCNLLNPYLNNNPNTLPDRHFCQ